MSTPLSSQSLQPGQFVRRLDDDNYPFLVGIVVGILLTPLEVALVRWSPTDTTLEPLDAVVEVLKLFG